MMQNDGIIFNVVTENPEPINVQSESESEKLSDDNISVNKLLPTDQDTTTKPNVISNKPYDNKTSKTNSFKKKNLLDLDCDNKVKDVDVFLKSKPQKIKSVFSELKFSSMKELSPILVDVLQNQLSIRTATVIQTIAIPEILKGRDVLIKSETGSGKTLSYLIPMINQMQAKKPLINRESGLISLIISPTRELTTQTHEVIESITKLKFPRIVSNSFVAGIKAKVQKRALRKGVNVIVATPNRLLYHMENTENLDFKNLEWLIIDEADKMLELGFGNNIKTIIEKISQVKCQKTIKTILLSATLNEEVEKIASYALNNPFHAFEEVDKNLNQNTVAIPSSLQQHLIICPMKLRLVGLLSFLMLKCRFGNNKGKVVVFMATQDIVEFHYMLFKTLLKDESKISEIFPTKFNKEVRKSLSSVAIYQLHGAMEHTEREAIFKEFSTCTEGFLLTTDVSSRGLDMTSINWVVQYNAPSSPQDYVHRIGRTARAGQGGKSLLFLQASEVNFLGYLEETIGLTKAIEKVGLRSVLERALVGYTTNKTHTPEEKIFLTNKTLENIVISDETLLNLARASFKSFVRSYTTFPKDMRQFFCYKDLHFGHVAKSMALREKPSEIGKNYKVNLEEMTEDKRKKMQILISGKKRKAIDDARKPKKSKLEDIESRNLMMEFL